jgi:hypothetical protein
MGGLLSILACNEGALGIVWFGLGLVPQLCNPTPIDFTLGFCIG